MAVSQLLMDRNGYLSMNRKYMYHRQKKNHRNEQQTLKMNRGWRDIRILKKQSKEWKKFLCPRSSISTLAWLWLLGYIYIYTHTYRQYIVFEVGECMQRIETNCIFGGFQNEWRKKGCSPLFLRRLAWGGSSKSEIYLNVLIMYEHTRIMLGGSVKSPLLLLCLCVSFLPILQHISLIIWTAAWIKLNKVWRNKTISYINHKQGSSEKKFNKAQVFRSIIEFFLFFLLFFFLAVSNYTDDEKVERIFFA